MSKFHLSPQPRHGVCMLAPAETASKAGLSPLLHRSVCECPAPHGFSHRSWWPVSCQLTHAGGGVLTEGRGPAVSRNAAAWAPTLAVRMQALGTGWAAVASLLWAPRVATRSEGTCREGKDGGSRKGGAGVSGAESSARAWPRASSCRRGAPSLPAQAHCVTGSVPSACGPSAPRAASTSLSPTD